MNEIHVQLKKKPLMSMVEDKLTCRVYCVEKKKKYVPINSGYNSD